MPKHEKVSSSSKGIDNYVKKQIKYLSNLKKKSRTIWNALTVTIGIINLIVVCISAYLLITIIASKPKVLNFLEIGPTAIVCFITILVFILSFIIAINTNLKIDHKYRKMINIIQHEQIKFNTKQDPYKGVHAEKKFNKYINEKINEIFSQKKKLKLKKVLLIALIGDKNE